jgi:hypothetical protein
MKSTPPILAAVALVLGLSACGDNTVSEAPKQTAAPAITHSVTQSGSSSQVAAAAYTTVVQQLYVSYFGRPADTGGLASFTARMASLAGPTEIQNLDAAYKASAPIRELIDSFGSSAESAALYSGNTTTFVTAIYTNVLGRAPDDEGRNFWVGEIDSGRLTRANASLSIMAGALANTTAQGQLDAQLVNKRIAVGTNFTAALNTSARAAAYSGDAAAATARSLLTGVTAGTDVTAYQANIESAIGVLMVNTGPTFAQIRPIIDQRCLQCHSDSVASGGISWASDATVRARASDINRVVVLNRTMPQGNLTGMTEAERTIIRNWFMAGAN